MLEVKNLMVFYENMLAVNNVSMSCEKGQIVGVFGANSAGKSTLMYALSGIMLDIKKKEEMSVLTLIYLASRSLSHAYCYSEKDYRSYSNVEDVVHD